MSDSDSISDDSSSVASSYASSSAASWYASPKESAPKPKVAINIAAEKESSIESHRGEDEATEARDKEEYEPRSSQEGGDQSESQLVEGRASFKQESSGNEEIMESQASVESTSHMAGSSSSSDENKNDDRLTAAEAIIEEPTFTYKDLREKFGGNPANNKGAVRRSSTGAGGTSLDRSFNKVASSSRRHSDSMNHSFHNTRSSKKEAEREPQRHVTSLRDMFELKTPTTANLDKAAKMVGSKPQPNADTKVIKTQSNVVPPATKNVLKEPPVPKPPTDGRAHHVTSLVDIFEHEPKSPGKPSKTTAEMADQIETDVMNKEEAPQELSQQKRSKPAPLAIKEDLKLPPQPSKVANDGRSHRVVSLVDIFEADEKPQGNIENDNAKAMDSSDIGDAVVKTGRAMPGRTKEDADVSLTEENKISSKASGQEEDKARETESSEEAATDEEVEKTPRKKKTPFVPPEKIVPRRTKSKELLETINKQRDPLGHRFQEDYTKPPPNFTFAKSKRKFSSNKEPAPSKLNEETEEIVASAQQSTTVRSAEPYGKRLAEGYTMQYVTYPLDNVLAAKKNDAVKTVSQERLQSQLECDGISPRDDMYPSDRVPVDVPGPLKSEPTVEEKLIYLEEKAKAADNLSRLRKMKADAARLKLEILTHDTNKEQLAKPIATTKPQPRDSILCGDDEITKSIDNLASQLAAIPAKDKDSTVSNHHQDVNPHEKVISQLERDMQASQAAYEQLVQLCIYKMSVMAGAKPFNYPQRTFSVSASSDDLLRQIEYETLNEKLKHEALIDQVDRLLEQQSAQPEQTAEESTQPQSLGTSSTEKFSRFQGPQSRQRYVIPERAVEGSTQSQLPASFSAETYSITGGSRSTVRPIINNCSFGDSNGTSQSVPFDESSPLSSSMEGVQAAPSPPTNTSKKQTAWTTAATFDRLPELSRRTKSSLSLNGRTFDAILRPTGR